MATRKKFEMPDGRVYLGGYQYEMDEWVNFLAGTPDIPSDVQERLKPLIEVFTKVSADHFDRFLESKGMDRDNFGGRHPMDDNNVAYLSFCTLVGHGVGFWSESMDYADDSAESLALAEYSDLIATLDYPVGLTCDIDALMYDADPDNEDMAE